MTSAKQVRAQYTQEFKLEAVRQVKAGQAIAVVGKVLGIPKASLSNWVRLAAKGKLDGGDVTGKAVIRRSTPTAYSMPPAGPEGTQGVAQHCRRPRAHWQVRRKPTTSSLNTTGFSR